MRCEVLAIVLVGEGGMRVGVFASVRESDRPTKNRWPQPSVAHKHRHLQALETTHTASMRRLCGLGARSLAQRWQFRVSCNSLRAECRSMR